MAIDELAFAKETLQNWKDFAWEAYPLRHVVWLSPGSTEAESMVRHHMRVLQDELRANMPDVAHTIFTTCRDVRGWQESFVVPLITQFRHGGVLSADVALAFLMETGWARLKNTLVVTNGMAAAFTFCALGRAYDVRPRYPLIVLFAKVPEGRWDYVPEYAAEEIIGFLARDESLWFCVLDNAHEVELLQGLLDRAGMPQEGRRIRRVRTYRWDRHEFSRPRRDVVVWSGRGSKMKNFPEGLEIFSLLPNVDKEMFFPHWKMMDKRLGRDALPPRVTIYVSEPSERYRALAGDAKVLLATSFAEGAPAGYIELMGLGCIPVFPNRPWALDLVPPGWPFLYTSTAEGASMIEEAMGNYDKYAEVLYAWMGERFSGDPGFTGIIKEAWETFLLARGDGIPMTPVDKEWIST